MEIHLFTSFIFRIETYIYIDFLDLCIRYIISTYTVRAKVGILGRTIAKLCLTFITTGHLIKNSSIEMLYSPLPRMDFWGTHVQNSLILPGRICNSVRLHTDCNLFRALHRRRLSLLRLGVLVEVHSLHLGFVNNCEPPLVRGVSHGDSGFGDIRRSRNMPGGMAE